MIQFLNVSFGIYVLHPLGWLFMFLVVFFEGMIISESLTDKAGNRLIFNTVIISNLVSGLVGFIISMVLTGGWWLVVWIPWVSDNEVRTKAEFQDLLAYYLIAFVLTIVIENILNINMLKKHFKKKSILKTTMMANLITYILGSFVLYIYSFG